MIRQVCSTPSWRVNRDVSPAMAACRKDLVGGRALTAHLCELDVEQDRRRRADVRPVGVEDDARAGRGVELDHELIRFGSAVEGREAEARRVLEDEADLGLRHRQALPRADEEGDARPAPVVDVEPERRVRLGRRVVGHALDRAVAVVLAPHVLRGVGRADRAEQGDLRLLERVHVAARGGLHRRHAHDLHQVVDDDVAQRSDRVVEVAAVLDAEVLGHRDLHALDVVPVPDRLEHRVGEAEVEDLLDPHLPEVVVDPQELRFVDVLVELRRERPRGLEVVAEGLLDDDARLLRQPRLREPLDHGAEEERRDLEVEDA